MFPSSFNTLFPSPLLDRSFSFRLECSEALLRFSQSGLSWRTPLRRVIGIQSRHRLREVYVLYAYSEAADTPTIAFCICLVSLRVFMFADNPSYFSVVVDTNGPATKRSPRMGNAASVSDTVSTSSECSLGRQFTPPLSLANKRCLRNLLRSVSSTSADSNQELLIMGEPRLSDIAPELNIKLSNEPRRSNSLKTTRTDNRNLYLPLPTSEIEADELSGEDEEVFISENSARYYNLTAKHGNTVANRRRHSIGTVMARERSVSVTSSNASFKDDFPQVIIHATADGNTVGANSVPIDDHSMRHSSYPRKRCNRCTRGEWFCIFDLFVLT